ncbi:MAG: hypothetical protein IPN69_03495 [Acidobacteria bacterium]|nr:hypothetical protein [Acidobacteriota bacterium]
MIPIVLLAGLFNACDVEPANGSSSDANRVVEVAEIPYCDLVANPTKCDGKTVVATGTLFIAFPGGAWMNGPECENDNFTAAAFAANEQVGESFAKNSWQTDRILRTKSLRVRIRGRFLNRPPEKSSNQLAKYQVWIEEVIEATPSPE